MRSMSEMLRMARDKIIDKNHWTSGHAAKDANGRPISYRHPNATSWCAVGAIRNITGTTLDGRFNGSFKVHCFLESITQEKYGLEVKDVNDILGYEAIMECFDIAIKKADEIES